MVYRSASIGNWMAMNGHVMGEGLLDDLLLLLGLLLHVGEGLVPALRAGELLLLKVLNNFEIIGTIFWFVSVESLEVKEREKFLISIFIFIFNAAEHSQASSRDYNVTTSKGNIYFIFLAIQFKKQKVITYNQLKYCNS